MMTCTIFAGFQLRRSGTTSSVLQSKTLRIEKWSVFQKDDWIPRLVHFLPQVSRNARQSLKHGCLLPPKVIMSPIKFHDWNTEFGTFKCWVFSIEKIKFFKGWGNQAYNSWPDGSLSWTLKSLLKKHVRQFSIPKPSLFGVNEFLKAHPKYEFVLLSWNQNQNPSKSTSRCLKLVCWRVFCCPVGCWGSRRYRPRSSVPVSFAHGACVLGEPVSENTTLAPRQEIEPRENRVGVRLVVHLVEPRASMRFFDSVVFG